MTYKDIINRVRQIVQDHKQLESFGYGQLSDLKTQVQITPEADYPYLFLVPGTHTRSGAVMTYNFNMIVMDMARGEEGDVYQNYITIQSDCQQYIDDVLAHLYYYYQDQPEVQFSNVSYTPFKEKYQDEVAGMTATLSIQVPTPLNDCITPFQDYVLQVEATLLIDKQIGTDPGEDKSFQFPTDVSDPNSEWFVTYFKPVEAGQYKFEVDLKAKFNLVAPGETLISEPLLKIAVPGSDTFINPTSISYWPTAVTDPNEVFDITITYEAEITNLTSQSYVGPINFAPTPPMSNMWELAGSTIKIYQLI